MLVLVIERIFFFAVFWHTKLASNDEMEDDMYSFPRCRQFTTWCIVSFSLFPPPPFVVFAPLPTFRMFVNSQAKSSAKSFALLGTQRMAPPEACFPSDHFGLDACFEW